MLDDWQMRKKGKGKGKGKAGKGKDSKESKESKGKCIFFLINSSSMDELDIQNNYLIFL